MAVPTSQPDQPPSAGRYVAVRLLLTLAFGGVLLGAAGRWDWGAAWLYVAFVLCGELASAAVLLVVNREVLRQRGRAIRPDTAGFDRIFVPLYLLVGYATGAVAGLDAGRSGAGLPTPAWLGGGALLTVAGYALGTWAMAVNEYLEPTVRIQTDRGHRVVTTGPYRYVRHPAYVGAMLGSLGAPFMLGSTWMFVPVAASVALFVGRTRLEDELLQRELPGYRAYAQRTRYRLLPGIW
jgi:protein-S-isoprenylcysteine O-methyltransferase Ste14